MKRALLLLFAVLTTTGAHAESWATTKAVCHDWLTARPVLPPNPEPAWRLHTLEECGIDLFTLDPAGPTAGNIGTGSGFGGGMRIVWAPDANHTLTLKGLYSINSSYVGSGKFEILFRPFRPIVIKSKNGHPGQTDLTKGNIDFNLVRFDMRTQDFYGLGPSSTLAGHAVYRQQETWAGVNGYAPLPYVSGRSGIVGALGEFKYVRPITKGVSGTSLPSVDTGYGESGAPASTLQPDFLEVGAGLSIRTPAAKPVAWEKHEAQVTYQHYFEQGSNQFSFDRLEGWGDVNLEILKASKAKSDGRWSQPDLSSRPWWKDALCMQGPLGNCSIGTIVLAGRVTTSYTGSSSRVPFYLQPTLGGADFDGKDTLRGLVDYRLRAPNRLLMQVDFDKPIAQLGIKGHPLGQYGLYTFFDAGNVSLTPGQLIDNGLRKDVGVGISVAIQNKIVLRAYIAFGAGEGSHPNAKMANAF
jgi:hypothetical protein